LPPTIIRPGNGEGLFCMVSALHKFVTYSTYLDTYPVTYSPAPARGPLILEIPEFLTTECRRSWGYLLHRKPSRSIPPFRYNTV